MPQLRSQRGASGSASIEVKLRKVVPVLPSTEPEKAQLMEDLTSMGCQGFAEKPWGFMEERVVRELIGTPSNEFDNTLRATPTGWTEEIWRTVYGFRSGGLGMAGRKEEFVRGKFHGAVNPKDGYAVEDCTDERHRRLLQFIVPVLHPEKPTRVTLTLGNTIFGSLSGDRKVDWARVVSDLVAQLISRVGKSRATPVCPYLFHLYRSLQLLKPDEEKAWKVQEALLKYGEAEDDETESETGSGSESEEEEPMPPPKRQKTTPTHRRRTPSGPSKEPKAGPETGGASSSRGTDPEDPFNQLITLLCHIRADCEIKKEMLVGIGGLVGAPVDSNLQQRVAECIVNPIEERRREEEGKALQSRADRLQTEVLLLQEELAATRGIATETRTAAELVRTSLGEPGAALAKARLFDEEVHKNPKLSGARMVRILTDYSEQLDEAVGKMRKAADRIERSGQSLRAASASKETRLSDLSLPESFPDVELPRTEPEQTPESKKSASQANQSAAPSSPIVIESSPGSCHEVPNPVSEGDRNRNLNDIFEQMEP